MLSFGEILRKIRTLGNWTLSEVAESVSIEIDLLSKIERGERTPSKDVVLRLSSFYQIDKDELLILLHYCTVRDYLLETDNGKSITEMLLRAYNDPSFDISIPTPLNISSSKRVKTVKPSTGKVKGFNFYLQRNGKLKKREREELIRRSEHYFGEIQNLVGNQSRLSFTQLDSQLSDGELIQQWNEFYERYGIQFPEFRKSVVKDINNKKRNTTTPKHRVKNSNSILGNLKSIDIDF